MIRMKSLIENLTGSVRRRQKLLGTEKSVWTEYLRWLSFVNAGMLTPGNVACFDHAIANLPSGLPVIEIGSFCGLSTNVISHLMDKHKVNANLITCDKWIFEGADKAYVGNSNIAHQDYRQYVKDSYIRNIKMFSKNRLPYTIELFSDEFYEAWSRGEERTDVLGRPIRLGGPIGFCYIDGNHSYEFAKRDFENCDRFLQAGGFVLFDDSAGAFEVSKLMPEVIVSGRYELVARNPNFFFRKIKNRSHNS